MPAKRLFREIVATSEVGRKSDEQNETRQLEVTRKEVDKEEDGIKPNELGSRIKEWAAAVDTSHTRVTFEEPIQSRVQPRRVENSWSAQKRQVTDKLR